MTKSIVYSWSVRILCSLELRFDQGVWRLDCRIWSTMIWNTMVCIQCWTQTRRVALRGFLPFNIIDRVTATHRLVSLTYILLFLDQQTSHRKGYVGKQCAMRLPVIAIVFQESFVCLLPFKGTLVFIIEAFFNCGVRHHTWDCRRNNREISHRWETKRLRTNHILPYRKFRSETSVGHVWLNVCLIYSCIELDPKYFQSDCSQLTLKTYLMAKDPWISPPQTP
jgi:hypothetical protein